MSKDLRIIAYSILLLGTIAFYQNPDLDKVGLFNVFKTETANKSGERITRERVTRERATRKRATRKRVIREVR